LQPATVKAITPIYLSVSSNALNTPSGRKFLLDSYTLKSENPFLTFEKNPKTNLPSLVGGDEGEGENWFTCPPPPLPTGRQAYPPPSKGEGLLRKFQIFLVSI
jgi:hypothetical protein